MLTAIIADDREAERKYFSGLLLETKKIQVLAEAGDGPAALDLISHFKPDLAFLDIEMPGASGLEVAREALNILPQIFIVFFTAHPDFAVDAFSLNSVDYLLKPVDAFRVRKMLIRVEEKMLARQAVRRVDNRRINKLAIKSKREIILINLNQIIFIEKSDKNTTIVHTMQRDYKTNQTISELEQRLEGHRFFQRVHKSYLINLNMVEKISYFADNSFLVKFTGYEKDALVSRKHIDSLKRYLNLDK